MDLLAIASDHAGFRLKESLIDVLQEEAYGILDCGCFSESSVDYPDLAKKVAEAIIGGRGVRYGLLICGTGIGMAMAANKYPGIRAAVCHDEYTAQMSRAHNDANVLALGARVLDEGLAKKVLTVWLSTPFEGGRHQRRVEKIG